MSPNDDNNSFTTHQQQRYECGQCDENNDMRWNSLSSLKNHFYTTHMIITDHNNHPPPSPITSDTEEDHHHHQNVDETVEENFKCEVKDCEKTFKKKSDRDRHEIRGHVPLSLRPSSVSCGVCDKLLSSNSQLSEHMRTHTGETPHVCHLCGKGFKSRGGLNDHMLSQKHGGPGLTHKNTTKKKKRSTVVGKRGRKRLNKVMMTSDSEDDDGQLNHDGGQDVKHPQAKDKLLSSSSPNKIESVSSGMPSLQLVQEPAHHQQSSYVSNNTPPVLVPQQTSSSSTTEQFQQQQQFWKFHPGHSGNYSFQGYYGGGGGS